jgi:quercetin dioxygenase-like cupin family protein
MVIVSGTFTYGAEGEAQKAYGPGSYLVIPGGVRHASGCAAGAPCVFFHEASGKFDMKPAGVHKP